MGSIISIVGLPLGLIMSLFYKVVNSYGLSLIIFTIIIRLLLVPLSIKQQKSTAKMTAFRPRMEEIQKKYANNRERMNEELMALYKDEGYSPTAGCLPMLIQMPILFGLIDVIYKPLKHILRLPSETISAGIDILKRTSENVSSYAPEISLINAVHNKPETFSSMPDLVSKIKDFDLNFLGINLGQIPTFALNLLILIPILSGITALITAIISMKNTNAIAGDKNPAQGATKAMMFLMPVMSLWIAFKVPAGVGVYWIISNILMAIQTMILFKVYNPLEMAEKVRQDMEQRKKKAYEERKVAKKLAKENNSQVAENALSQKEINRQKLAAARKRDALKYGEEYIEEKNTDIK